MVGQSWLLGGQHVAQDLQSQLHVPREESFVLTPCHKTCVPAALHGAGWMGLHTVNGPGFAQLGIGKASSSPLLAQET